MNLLLRLTVEICQFLRLTATFLAVLRLTVNPIETLFKVNACIDQKIPRERLQASC